MELLKKKWQLVFTASFLLIVIVTSVSCSDSGESSAAQTLQAIYAQDTAEALAEQALPAAEAGDPGSL